MTREEWDRWQPKASGEIPARSDELRRVCGSRRTAQLTARASTGSPQRDARPRAISSV